MAAKIYCRTTAKGIQSYFLNDGKTDYYLFNTVFRQSNKKFFSPGRYIHEVLDARRHHSTSVQRTSTRLIGAVKYIEKEYDVCVFNQTVKKQQKKKPHKARMTLDNEYEFAV